MCDFQNVNDQTASLKWVVGRPYPYSIDHTTSTNSSEFAFVNAASSPVDSKARLESIKYPAAGVECVQFWYMFETNNRAQAIELNVYEKIDSTYGTPKWSKHSKDDDRSWSYGQIEVGHLATSGEYTIVFEALKRTSLTNEPIIVGLDDVDIREGTCKPAINCDFEQDDICSWKQHYQNNINWLVNQGETDSSDTGPHVDVTLGTAEGHYLYIETSYPTKEGDTAILVSEYIDPTTSGSSSCFGLWYFMHGVDVGELSIWFNDTQTGLQIQKEIIGEQGFMWFQLFLSISKSNEFRIAIKGVVSNSFNSFKINKSFFEIYW